MLSILSSPLQVQMHANKQTQTVTHTRTHTKPILSNHRNIIQPVETTAEGNESNNRLYFPPSTPGAFFCFLSYGSFLERMQRQERQTYGMINYRHRHFLCQQYGLYSLPLMSSGLLFFASIFSLSGRKRKTE